MKIIFVFLTIFHVFLTVFATTDENLWQQFQEQHKKTYHIDEEAKRFKIFQENLRKIENHNARYQHGEESYYMGVTQFSDLTVNEFVQRLGPSIPTAFSSQNSPPLDVALPYSVDWRKEGILSNIKNSGTKCIASWAFSATAAMESYFAMGRRAVLDLSEQNLIDCSQDEGNSGCAGGSVSNSFTYVQDHGIMFQLDYPYEGQNGTCKFDRLKKTPVQTVGFAPVDSGEIPLMIAVTYNGPISTLMNGDSLQQYKGGILDPHDCSSDVNYNVLVIGYGVEETKKTKYWLIRNSFGTEWGEDGYFRMIRNESTICGFGTQNYFPLIY